MKKAVRKSARNILASLTVDEVDNLSRKVSENIFSLISDLISNHYLITDHLSIGAYVPIQSEVRWYVGNKLKSTLNEQFTFAVPHLVDETQMVYYQIDLAAIEQGNIGLSLEQSRQTNQIVPDVVLVPGLAFTSSGERLGRGKGYFDRYLANFGGIKIGVALEAQLFKELPLDEYDITMDYVVTEKQIYKGTNK